MLAPDPRFLEKGNSLLTSAPVRSDSAMSQFMEAMRESSLALLVRFPAPGLSALRPTEILREALESVLPEPCGIALLPFDTHVFAAVVTPRSEQPFDPLHVHSLLEMLHRALHDALGLPAEARDHPAAPFLLPLASVSSVNVLQENLAALNEMLETILQSRLRVQFQPIVHLAGGCVYGYEALIRSPQGGVLKRPGQLFQVADSAHLVSWLDIACQEKCFQEASRIGLRDHLFINMDAEGLSYLDLGERSLADRATELGIPPSRIVLEITERQGIEDFPRLAQYIEGLREQGFKIAIDDAGEGYSSLRAIAQLRPEFVKIARSLVRSIESNGAHRTLVNTFAQFAAQIGTSIIAEGVETRDELATVIECGVSYAQGYLLSRPHDGFKGLRREMREFIEERMAHHRERTVGHSCTAGQIARQGLAVPPDMPVEQVANKFEKNPEMESVVVIRDHLPEGLVMRSRFEQALSAGAPAGARPISRLMERRPLIVEADTPVEALVRQAACRREHALAEDIVVVQQGRFVGVVSLRTLIEAVAGLRINRAKYLMPLTGLPGPVLIEQEVNGRLAAEHSTTIVYADVDHFRAYNAHFGTAHGDEALIATARILEGAIRACGHADDFLGHRIGDDFILLLSPDTAEAVCNESIRQFDELARQLYSREARRLGYQETQDANGQARRLPLLSLTLVGVSNRRRPLRTFSQALAALRDPLRAARALRGSVCILDPASD